MPGLADSSLPRRSFLVVAAAGALGLTVAGCGDDEGSASTTASTAADATTGTTTESAKPASGALAIAMKDIQFTPKVATAKVGQEVVWTNDDAVQHDVRALQGADFHSDTFGKGGTYSFTPKKAGTIEYDCSLHPGMVGTLKVVA
ncbi:copper binding proteins plastocyanin/azurin family protein [Patulibacter medicamentivorans]|uniref:Copper binding proteins plastocyanin/azurin family protein n=1 Tax=Patulibacter medicamentivorans TaxID=1097667 RepID=H0E0J0_9ACTN|nr:plastocyanin/azurin family copper-binding protein [Patulibacter medicamentivorans]EHN12809.1 copper binding proteins plastocyanin/azurin family protein [Patulibacter medicamentivorans]